MGREELERGIRLFKKLAELNNSEPECVGIGYQQFSLFLFDVSATFKEWTGMTWKQSHATWAISLTHEITEKDGRLPVTRNGATIEAGMDTFIWEEGRMKRPDGAFHPSNRQQTEDSPVLFKRVFALPRRLITDDERWQLLALLKK